MAPVALRDVAVDHDPTFTDLKSKVSVKHIEVESPSDNPPVADNYMYDFKYNHALPTTNVLGIGIPDDCDAQEEASLIVTALSDALADNNADSFAALFLEHGEI